MLPYASVFSTSAPLASAPFVQNRFGMPIAAQRFGIYSGLARPVVFPALNAPGQTSAAAQVRRQVARQLAERFDQATLGTWGSDEVEVKRTLEDVVSHGVQQDFQAAVRQKAQQHGLQVSGAQDVIDKELGGNFLTRTFKAAPRNECQDLLRTGRNTYSSSAWAYRRYGMYRSLANFASVCKNHPLMSMSVIGAVSYLGGRFPFLGATSGVAIMAWASGMSAWSELKARKSPVMDAHKAEALKQSGENMAAFLMTAPGIHGITEGTVAGWNVLFRPKPEGAGATWLNRVIEAIKLDKNSPEFTKALSAGEKTATKANTEKTFRERAMAAVNGGLFVFGLFDNVLLPFNWLADKLENKQHN